MVPCDRCNASEACYWEVAVWQPETCSHPRMPRDQLEHCQAGKQARFIICYFLHYCDIKITYILIAIFNTYLYNTVIMLYVLFRVTTGVIYRGFH